MTSSFLYTYHIPKFSNDPKTAFGRLLRRGRFAGFLRWVLPGAFLLPPGAQPVQYAYMFYKVLPCPAPAVPCCGVPKKWPGPRIRRSFSAITKPSVDFFYYFPRAPRRALTSDRLSRKQYDRSLLSRDAPPELMKLRKPETLCRFLLS